MYIFCRPQIFHGSRYDYTNNLTTGRKNGRTIRRTAGRHTYIYLTGTFSGPVLWSTFFMHVVYRCDGADTGSVR